MPTTRLQAVVRTVREAYGHHLVVAWELRGDRLAPRAFAGADLAGPHRLVDLPSRYGVLGRTLELAAGRARSSRTPAAGAPARRHRPRTRRSPSSPTTGRSWPSPIPGADGPWGVLLIVGETGGLARSARPRGRPRRRRRARRDRQRRPTRGRGRPPAPSSRGAAPGRQRHRQPARPRPDPVRPGRSRHGPVRGRPGAVFLQQPDGQRQGRGQPRPVGGLPRQRPRLPAAVAAGRRGGGPAAAVRGRLPRRPARRGRPRRRGPGGLRHAVHGAAARRHAPARPAQRLPRPAAPLDGRRARHDRRAGDPGERRHPGRPGLRADGDLGRPAPVDPAARRRG